MRPRVLTKMLHVIEDYVKDDKVKGGHPDVVVSGGRAYLFYFTHPGRRPGNPKSNLYDQRRSSIQVVELTYINGKISCDRDKPTYIRLLPIDKKL